MDIEKLKGSWKKYTSNLSSKELKNEEDLSRMLEKRRQRSLKLLRRNFLIEAGLNILIVPLLILFVLNTDLFEGVFEVYFLSLLAVIVVVFFFYLYRSYKKIYQYDNFDLYLRDKLKEQIKYLEKFIKEYHWFINITYFLALVFGLSIDLSGDALAIIIRLGAGLALGTLLFFILLRPFASIYINKLYRAHLDSLKRCLVELDDYYTENGIQK